MHGESVGDRGPRLPDDVDIVMVNLLRFRGDGGEQRHHRYAVVSTAEIHQRGGRVIFVGDRVDGADDWDRAALVHYPRRAAWLDMQSSPAYVAAIADRTAGLAARLLASCRRADPATPPIDHINRDHAGEVDLVQLVRSRPDTETRAHETVWKRVAELGGRVLLDLSVELALGSDDDWDRFVLLRFPSMDAHEAWTADLSGQVTPSRSARGVRRDLGAPG